MSADDILRASQLPLLIMLGATAVGVLWPRSRFKKAFTTAFALCLMLLAISGVIPIFLQGR